MDSKIKVKGLNHYFISKEGKKIKVLEDINLNIKDGEFIAIVGPSGCGKSTLLNIMASLIEIDLGEIYIDNIKNNGINEKIGYISQSDGLLPWRTVINNIELGLEIKGVGKEKRNNLAKDLIKRTGLDGFENSYTSELSGGMRKRVSICRTLALNPDILFLDEPFGPLDVFTKETLQQDILKLWENSKKTIVFITHDISEAITLADKIVLMTARPGKIKSIFNVKIPRPRYVNDIKFDKEFIEISKIIWNELKSEVEQGSQLCSQKIYMVFILME